MKFKKLLPFFVAAVFCIAGAKAQNVNLNIQTPPNGEIRVGEILFLEVYITNTNSSATVPAYKLRPLINFPPNVEVQATGHELPAGWTIQVNDGENFRVSNGTGTIPPNTGRLVKIAMKGKILGGPNTINANMFFSNGIAPGTGFGPPTVGDITADNNSNGAITVLPSACIPPAAPTVTSVSNCGTFTLSTDATGTLLWSTGATTSSITVSTPGSYTVTSSAGGCTSDPSTPVVIGNNPNTTWYRDLDGDGYGSTTVITQATQPAGYVATGGDCNDADAAIHPGAAEIGDGKDNNCNGQTDEGLACSKVYYADSDGDGFGTAVVKIACVQPVGYADKTGDCNDKDASVYPGATELNDGKDNNCNGQIDEGLGCTLKNFYPDTDGDGFGALTGFKVACTAPAGVWVLVTGDCNDKDATIYPNAPELNDGKDNDCDGQIDEGLACVQKPWFQDTDKDGFGSNTAIKYSCTPPVGYIAASGDCNDKDATIYPGAPELLDGKDNDCNGIADDGTGCTPVTYYQDFDKDGFGSTTAIKISCVQPVGYILIGGDCNDKDATIYPNAPELIDGKDNDCDGVKDEGTACTPQRWYQDADKDGFGSNTAIISACVQPLGYIQVSGDCNDKDATIYPGAPELLDGKDNDCDGMKDESCSPLIIISGAGGRSPAPQWLAEKVADNASLLSKTQVKADELQVTVFPNPAQSDFIVSLDDFAPNQKVQISLVQADGKVQKTQTLTPIAKGQQVRFNVNGLSRGMYIVNIKQGDKQQAKKLVVGSK